MKNSIFSRSFTFFHPTMLVPFLQRKNIFNTHDENLVGGFCFTPLVNAGAINATFFVH